MRSWKGAVLATALGLVAGTASCGSEEEEPCPGSACTNCSPGGDCGLICNAGQTLVCESLGLYGGDPKLRCVWCQGQAARLAPKYDR